MVNDKPILRAKISCPLPPANLVPRGRLSRQLSDGTRRPLTIVAAPAGFGKTALIAGWVHDSKRRNNVAWLSLDGDDNDPFRFLFYAIAALRTLDDAIGEAAQSAIGSLRRPALRDLMALLLNDFVAIKHRRLLVLEDFHIISNPEVDGLVTYAIDNLPRSLRIIINSRVEPRLPLPRWRANEVVSELGLRDLRFTDPEAAAFLRSNDGA
jgi:LuxR family maltose regulon positive regulatory protein